MKTTYSNQQKLADVQLANHLIRPVIEMYLLNVNPLKLKRSEIGIRIADQDEKIIWQGRLTEWECAIPAFISTVWNGSRPLKRVVIAFCVAYPQREATSMVSVMCKITSRQVYYAVGHHPEPAFPLVRGRLMLCAVQHHLKRELFREHLDRMVEVFKKR